MLTAAPAHSDAHNAAHTVAAERQARPHTLAAPTAHSNGSAHDDDSAQ
jgi:hypothetical protein